MQIINCWKPSEIPCHPSTHFKNEIFGNTSLKLLIISNPMHTLGQNGVNISDFCWMLWKYWFASFLHSTHLKNCRFLHSVVFSHAIILNNLLVDKICQHNHFGQKMLCYHHLTNSVYGTEFGHHCAYKDAISLISRIIRNGRQDREQTTMKITTSRSLLLFSWYVCAWYTFTIYVLDVSEMAKVWYTLTWW